MKVMLKVDHENGRSLRCLPHGAGSMRCIGLLDGYGGTGTGSGCQI